MTPTNPHFIQAVKENPMQGTPLMDAADPITPTPPREVRFSTAQLEAWKKVRGRLSDSRTIILAIIAEIGPATSTEIAREAEWAINRVSGRITELYNFGLIDDVGSKYNPETKANSTLWQAKPNYKELLEIVPSYMFNS